MASGKSVRMEKSSGSLGKRPSRVEPAVSAVNDRAMFTGLVEAAVPVRSFVMKGTGARLVLPAPREEDLALTPEAGSWGGATSQDPWEAGIGDSIAIAGTCLTVAELQKAPDGAKKPDMVFDLTQETLERTWFGALQPGHIVNLERALMVGARLGGHMVSGHVDVCGTVLGREDVGDGGAVFTFEVPEGFERFLVDKGSITIDGISLTVVSPEGCQFQVAVIPHTLDRTHLGRLAPGQPVHLEADLVAKWVERLTVR